MEVKLIMKSARNAVIEIADGGIYNTKETYHVLLNGEEVFSTDTVINSYAVTNDTVPSSVPSAVLTETS